MYDQHIDRSHPGCIVVLLDQSGSMREVVPDGSGRSKAEALAEAINSLLYELCLRSIKDGTEGPRHYYDVAVLGYGGTGVRSAFGGALAGRSLVPIVDVANHPLRVEERLTGHAAAPPAGDPAMPRGARMPVWIDARAAGGTPMGAALDAAGATVAPWVQAHPGSFPPIVVNISDGAATDGDPMVWARRIRSLSTADGPVLLFNLNLSARGGDALFFPSRADALPNDHARTLFEMSSPLPPHMCQLAGAQGMLVRTGARGYVFNADVDALVRFLQIGTVTTQAMG